MHGHIPVEHSSIGLFVTCMPFKFRLHTTIGVSAGIRSKEYIRIYGCLHMPHCLATNCQIKGLGSNLTLYPGIRPTNMGPQRFQFGFELLLLPVILAQLLSSLAAKEWLVGCGFDVVGSIWLQVRWQWSIRTREGKAGFTKMG